MMNSIDFESRSRRTQALLRTLITGTALLTILVCFRIVKVGAQGPARGPLQPRVGLNGGNCAYDTIGEALAAASPGDTLYLSQGTYNERPGTIDMDLAMTAASADCTQAADLPQYAVDIDANDEGAAFGGVIELGANHTLTLTNLYLSDGTASFGGLLYVHAGSTVILDDTDLGYGTASQYGGGIRLRGTAVFRNGSTLFSSRVLGSGDGGGVSIVNGGHLILQENSAIGFCGSGFANVAGGDGGGVHMIDGTLQLYSASRICNNEATLEGGGIYATGGAEITLSDQAYLGGPGAEFGNRARIGAGAYLTGTASLRLEDSTLVGFNTAALDGGGLAVRGNAGLLAQSPDVEIADNQADARGGGVWLHNPRPGGLATVSLEGVAIVRNAADYGGGLYLAGEGATARITGAVIRGNIGSEQGGGLQIHPDARVGISEVTIAQNEATRYSGGGLAVLPGAGAPQTVAISSTHILSNTAGTDGGGIYAEAASLVLNNTNVAQNSASGQGGGLAAANGAQVTVQATMVIPAQLAETELVPVPCDPALLPPGTYCSAFRDNVAGGGGGGVLVAAGSALEVFHTAFIGNQAGTVGGAVFSESSGDAVSLVGSLFHDNAGANVVRVFFGSLQAEGNTLAGNPATAISVGWSNPPAVLANNIIWDNAGGVVSGGAEINATCSISQNGVGGQIRDPDFVSAARGPYHLGLGSYAVDVCGSGPGVDLDNLHRPVNHLWDMGAFERLEYGPVARSDVYTATQDTQLVVLAPGVLANDQDANGDPLTVSLAESPMHGGLVLNPDGSFTYTPDEGYLGQDQFTYAVTDGGEAATAVVNLMVVKGPSPVYLPAIFRQVP